MLPQASRTTIEGAAHAIHFDRPAEFVQAVQRAAAETRHITPPAEMNHSTSARSN
jgi:hypothetical protein